MIKKGELLYLTAFIIYCLIALSSGSVLIKISDFIKIILYLAIIILFSIKIILDKNKIKALIIYAIIAIICIYAYIKTGTIYFFINFLAIISIKNVDIKKVVKVDLILKCVFIFTHTIIYGINYFMDYESIKSFIITSDESRLRNSLYFSHPNIASGLVLWAIIDALYLLKPLKIKHIIISSIVMLIYYMITISRTSIIIYILFLILYFINSIMPNSNFYKKIITLGQRYGIEVMSAISIILAYLYRFGYSFVYLINNLTSGRVYLSYASIERYGINLFSNGDAINLEKFFVVDNFYIRCAVLYGIIFLILLMILEKFVDKDPQELIFEKILFIVLCFALFSEYYEIIIGNALPLLIISHTIINSKKKDSIKWKKKIIKI